MGECFYDFRLFIDSKEISPCIRGVQEGDPDRPYWWLFFPREDAKQVLTSIDPELSGGLSVTTELVGEYDVALLGNWVMPPTEEDPEMLSLPIVVYVAFDDEGKIEEMTIAALDLQPLTEAIRAAVKDGAAQASA